MDTALDTGSQSKWPRRNKETKKDAKQAVDAAAGPVFQRRYRQTIRKLDLWSVLKVSLCFYLAAFAIAIVAGVVLWLLASVAGVVKNVEDLVGQLLSSKNFHFLSAQMLEGALLIGLVLVALMVIITVLAAAFYNLFSELVGGIEMVVVEEEPAAGS